MRNLFFFILFLSSCTPQEIGIKNFDSKSWKRDVNGCNGDRMEQIDLLLNNTEKIQGMDSDEILSLLGKPDNTELYTRSQKFYHYYLTAGPDCDKQSAPIVSKLILRFNATGLVKEVSLYD